MEEGERMVQNGERKGILNQIIVPVIIALLAGASHPWWTEYIFKDIPVQCIVSTQSISSGDQVEIRVKAFTEKDSPVSGASVRIETGGGCFSTSGTTTEFGQTDSAGVFVTRWRSPKPASSEYIFFASVNKNWFTKGHGESKVIILEDTTPPPPVVGGQIQVRFTANPHSIPAGGQVEIRVLAFTEQDSPVSGANVRIESGGGWFSASGSITEVGQTDSGGVFATRWTSPNPAAGGYEMAVKVTKKGFTEGKDQFNVPIDNKEAVEPSKRREIINFTN
jgi:hypothetical protein